MNRKIKANKAECLNCGDIIESKAIHDWVACRCGAIFVDGGKHYLRRGGEMNMIKDLTEYE